jgi:hypothetical protein
VTSRRWGRLFRPSTGLPLLRRSQSAFRPQLKDVWLTNKLLRMVNTVCYKRFGGSISTISRAVAVLGFNAVRNSALSLILFEHLKNGEQRGELRRMMGKSFLASEIARDLSDHLHTSTPEEGRSPRCSMILASCWLRFTFTKKRSKYRFGRHRPDVKKIRWRAR